MILTSMIIALIGYGLSTIFYFLFLILYRQKFLYLARGFIGLGFLSHALNLLLNIFHQGSLWMSGSTHAPSIFAWILVLFFFLIGSRIKVRIMGCVVPFLAFLMSLATISRHPVGETSAKTLPWFWLTFHLMGAVLGEALFAMTAILAILYLIQEKQLKSRNPGFWLHRIPPIQTLDNTIDRTLKWGFFLLSFGLITGSIWAHTAMREIWSMDPKQLWAMITWVVYALILFSRTHFHLHGKRGAILAILGSILVLFTVLGTNVIYENSHNFWMMTP